jgi:serine/threonine protein kinase
LGEGTFGKVYLVRRKETGDIYALKIVCLPEESSEKDLECIQTEHEIFKKIAGDHLVKAPFSFTEKDSQIFVMEFMPGGDLRQLLNEEVYFEEEAARFYLAEMVMAIEHLHNFSIIHRDLKPENLVIDEKGHIKLTDFGLSAMAIK